MLSSSCAAALLAGTGGQAAAQDAPRLWGAWGELGAQAGAETNAFLEGFMPIGQDADSIVFLDMRLDYGENSRGSTSLGLGIREIVGPDLILGANVFVDAVRTENGNTFAGATLGLEAFTSIFDLRVNAHVPIGGGTTLSPIVTGDGVSIVNNQLVENRTRTDRKEGLLYGLTGEIGAMFDSPFADNQRLRAYAGGYVYDRGGYDTQAGGRLGLEYQINDVLSLAGSRFTLGAELVYDKDDEFDAIASARLRIPLFAGAQSRDANGESQLSAIQQRMDEGVRRDKGIRVGTESSTTAVNGVPVINPATGNPFGGVYYADQAGGGTGSFADPTSLATAVANAGTDGIVIALGGGGPITTSGITLQSGQTLIGGGESIQVQLADGSTTNFLLSGTNGTIVGDPGVTTVTLASGVTIRDLTIQGGTTVIGGNAVSNFTLTDLNIQNATDGISVTGAVNANVSNISFSGITGTSLFLNNQSATISNITINGGTNGLSIANNTGTTTLSNINVSNVSGDALTFSNNTGVINVSGFTATNTGDDAIAVTGGGTFGFTGTTTLSGLGAGASSDGIDLSNTNNATLTFGDVDVTGLGGGTGLNMAGADATLTMQSLDITGAGTAGSKGVDLSGTQNGRTVTITNGGTIANVDVGLVLGTNGGASAAPDAVFTWGGGDIGGLTYALDGIGVNAANGSYAFGTTGFSGAFNFTTSGTPNYFIAASATGTGDGSSTANRASIATAIGAAAGLGTVNFVLINDGSAIDTSGLTFALAANQSIDTFGDGRTFTSAGLIIAANITGTNLPAGTTAITDPTGNGAATLTNSSGAISTITVANGNAIRNITLGSTLGTALSGSGIAGLTIEGVTIGTGTDTPVNGIALTNTTGAVTLTNVDITNSTGTGLSLTAAGGTVTGNNVDITGANALSVTGGDAVVSFNATSSVTNTSGTAVSITNRIGGSFSHFGAISSNGPAAGGISIVSTSAASDVTFGGQVALGTTTALGGGAGVDIDNNGQASAIAFTGGLEIATSGQAGLTGTGGGTLRVTNAGTERIDATNAAALSLSGMNIDAAFDAINATNSNISSVVLRNLDGSLAVNGGTLATVASGGSFNSFDVTQNDGAATRALSLTVDGLTITHDASGGSISPSEHGIVVTTSGDDSAVVSISNSTFQTEDSAVRVIANNGLATVTNFADNTLLGDASSFDPAVFANGVMFQSVTFDADLATAGIQAVDGGTFTAGAPGLAVNHGIFFDNIAGTNNGQINFTNYNVNAVGFGLSLGSGNPGLTVGIADGAVTAGTLRLGAGAGAVNGDITLSSLALSGGLTANDFSGSFTVTGATTINAPETFVDFGGGVYQRFATNAVSVVDSAANFTFGGNLTIASTPAANTMTGGSTVGINLDGNSGTFTVSGTTTITDTVEDAIRITDTSGAISFGQTAIVNPHATQSVSGTFHGAGTPEAHSAAIDISGTVDGDISFADLDITLNSANSSGIELTGATLNASVTAGDFDLTGNGSADTIGVDLRDVLGGGTVRLGDAAAGGADATIAGVETGVFVNAASDAEFIFGDGEGAIDQESTISATTAIDATSAPVAGTYNFQDVDFAGSPGAGFGIGAIYFVDSDGATGGGDGSGSSAANPMTLAEAENLAGAGDIIVLIDNGSAITAAGTNTNDTLDLAASQQLLSFGNGAGGSQAIQVSLTVPPTIQLFAAGLTIADPTGNGAATLTTSAGNDVVTLGGDGIRVSGIDFQGNGTAARAINDAGGATGTVIERSSVSNFATVGIEITPSTNTTINDVDFSGNVDDILLNAAGSTLSNITSTGATGTAITLTNATGTTTLSNIDISNAANGLSFNNASGTVTATNVDIAGGNTLAIDGGDAVFTFDDDSSITATSGTAVRLTNRDGGGFTHEGTVVADGTGTAGIASSGANGAQSIFFTGTVDLGTTSALDGAGVDIDNNGQTVTITFANIDIVTATGTGMDVRNGGTLSIGTGSLSVDNAQILNLSGIALGAGGVTFTSITGTNIAGAAGIGLNTVTGGNFTVSGTTSVSGTTGSAFAATDVAANMNLGTLDLTLTSGDGLLLDGNGGTLTTGDMTIAMGTGGNGIRATGTNGTMTFGNVDITDVGTGTGLNLSGGTFDGQATFATLDITGNGSAGSKGIDLTGYDNTKDVVTTNSSAIFNVETGIDLTNAVIGAGVRFQYGDGNATDPGTESKIDTTGFALVTTDMGTTGEFDLEDVEFATELGTTDISNLTGPVVFVVDQNNSSGAGTFSDPGSISEAAAATADVIVLIDTDTGTGTQTVNLGSALTLDDGQVLIGLDSGTTSIDVSTLGVATTGAPANLLLTGLGSSSTITSTVTLDSNRLVLNSSSGNTVNLTGSAGIQNVAITNTGTGDGISASFGAAHTLTLRSSAIGGGTGGYAINVATTTGASSFDFSNLALTSGLHLDGSGGGALSGTMTGTNTIAGATGQAIALNAVTLNPGGMTFDTISANGGGTVANGIALNNLGSGSSFSVTGTTTLDNYTGFGIAVGNLSQATQTISFGAVNINTTVGQVVASGDGLSIDTISAPDVNLDFGAVTIGNATDPSGTGVAVTAITNAATGFDLDFASLDLVNVALGVTVDGFDAPGASTATVAGTTNITANTFDGIRIINSDGDVTFGGRTTITNSGPGAGADGVDLGADAGGANTGAYTFNGVDITVNGTGAYGFRATSSGTVTINDPSSNNQITSDNGTALYINPTLISLDLQSVTSGNATGSGVFIDGGDAVGGSGASAVDIANLTVTNSAGAGLRITNSTGTFTFGATTISNAGSAGGGVDLDLGAGGTATVNFTGGLDIDTNSGTGFDANGTAGTLLTVNVASAGTRAINTATGRILDMDRVTVGGSGVSFDTLESSGTTAGDAISLTSVSGGAFNGGAVSVAGASGDGILLSGNTATIQFGTTGVINAAGDGIEISGSGATFGATTIINPGARGIAIGTTVGTTFDDVDITNLANNTTGVDLTSASGTINFTTLDISSASLTTGTTGIDLTGATNASDVTITNSSTINNLGVGVDLTNANITGTFRYGDGEGVINTNSNISNTTTAIVITGVTANGTYNFQDVAFASSGTSNLGSSGGGGGTVYWVAATPTGAANGSSADNAGSIAHAETANADYIVLLDNAGTGGQDTINLGSVHFALDANQSLLSFRNGDTFNFGGGAPSNIQLTGITGGTTITNPNTGSGAPLLTSNGTTTVTMAAGSVIDGVEISNTLTTSSSVISATDVNGSLTVQNSLITAASITIGVDIEQSGGFSGTTVALIAYNTINYTNRWGIAAVTDGTGRIDLTATNNLIDAAGAVGNGFTFGIGNGTAATLCANISGNTVTDGSRGIFADIFGSPGSTAELLLPGFTGPANDATAAETFVIGENTFTGQATEQVSITLDNAVMPANPAACQTP